jgi:Flp pilus assembly protein TadG
MIAGITSRFRAFFAARGGASAMEFALLALPMLLLLLSVLEFGRLQWTRNAVEEVAAAGARCIGLNAVNCSDNGSPRVYSANKSISFMVVGASNWMINVAASDIVISTSATCQGLTNFVQVTINHQFNSGLLSLAGISNYPMSSVACYPNQG